MTGPGVDDDVLTVINDAVNTFEPDEEVCSCNTSATGDIGATLIGTLGQ